VWEEEEEEAKMPVTTLIQRQEERLLNLKRSTSGLNIRRENSQRFESTQVGVVNFNTLKPDFLFRNDNTENESTDNFLEKWKDLEMWTRPEEEGEKKRQSPSESPGSIMPKRAFLHSVCIHF
jgi:hypothetical protein